MMSTPIQISILSVAFFWSLFAAAEPMYGVLMVVKGTVKVTTPQNQTTDAKVGGKVQEGDKIVTAADSRAKIVMADRNVINVNPDTEMVISKYENDAVSGKKNVELNLLKGKVRNNVEQTYDGEKNKFLIKTPTAVAGVRGTQFLAGFDPKTRMTSIVTFKGAVTLASVNPQGSVIGAPVLIKKGEMTQAAPEAVPDTPKPMPKEEIKKLDGESTASLKGKNAAPEGEPQREVASEGGVSKNSPAEMIDVKDKDLGMAKEFKDVRVEAPLTPKVVATPPVVQTTPPPIVNSIISNTNQKTQINVRPVPQN